MTGQEIINKFELYFDDMTELSSSEELDLLNKKYQEVCDEKVWEFLKKEASGTMTTTTTIAVPSDFGFFVENYNYTDNSYSTEINQKPTVVWIGTMPFFIVNWSDRRQYVNKNGYCYLDLAASVIRFPVAQSSGASYLFDYKAVPVDLALGTSPIFPARYHDMLYHAMIADDVMIQLFDKARSYAAENMGVYKGYMARMSKWNADLQNN